MSPTKVQIGTPEEVARDKTVQLAPSTIYRWLKRGKLHQVIAPGNRRRLVILEEVQELKRLSKKINGGRNGSKAVNPGTK